MTDDADRKEAIEGLSQALRDAVSTHADHALDLDDKSKSFKPIAPADELSRLLRDLTKSTTTVFTAWMRFALTFINPPAQQAPENPTATLRVDVDCGTTAPCTCRRSGLRRVGDQTPIAIKKSAVTVQPAVIQPGPTTVTLTIQTKGIRPGFYSGTLSVGGKPFTYEAYLDPSFDTVATVVTA